MEAKKALVRKNFDGSAEFARTVITNIVYFVSGVLVSKGQCLEIYLLSERLLRRLYQKNICCRHLQAQGLAIFCLRPRTVSGT